MDRISFFFSLWVLVECGQAQYVPSRQQTNRQTAPNYDNQVAFSGNQLQQPGPQGASQNQQNSGGHGQQFSGNVYGNSGMFGDQEGSSYATNQGNSGRFNQVQGYNSGLMSGSQAVIRPFQGSSAQNMVSQNGNSQNGKDNGNPLNKLNPDYLGVRPDYCKRPTGQFSVANDCTKFYNCHENIAWIMKCPEGLGFNEAIYACDYADVVGCAAAKDAINAAKVQQPATYNSGNGNSYGSPANQRPNSGMPNNGNFNPTYPAQAGAPGGAGVPQQFPVPNNDNSGQRNPGSPPFAVNSNPGYGQSGSAMVPQEQNTNSWPNQNTGGNPPNAVDFNAGRQPVQFPSGSSQPSNPNGNFPNEANTGNNWQNSYRPAVPSPCIQMAGGSSQAGGLTSPSPRQTGTNGNLPAGATQQSSSTFDPQSGFAVIEPQQRPSFSQTRSPNVVTNALEGDGGRQNGQDTRTVYGPNGPQMSPVAAACQPCSQLGATSCSNFPNAKCFDDVCGGCKARFFVPRPGASNPFAEVTSLCISATGAGESFPLQDTSNRIQPYR